MSTTPSAASTPNKLQFLADEVMACSYLSNGMAESISSALRELAAIKEAAQRQDSVYGEAVAWFRENHPRLANNYYVADALTIIGRRAAQITMGSTQI